MRLFCITLIAFTSVLFFACGQNTTESNNKNVATPKPSPEPTLKDEQRENNRVKENADRMAAIDKFITQKYKGWRLEGIASGECEMDEPCEIHLKKGIDNKVITIIMRRFYNTNGHNYWFVYEPTQLEISRLKINNLKELTRERVLEDLTADDCQSVIENIEDERDYPEPEPPDA